MARLRIFPFSESSWKQEEKLLANQKQLDKPKEIKKRKQILAKGKKRLKEDEQKNNPPKLKLAPIREKHALKSKPKSGNITLKKSGKKWISLENAFNMKTSLWNNSSIHKCSETINLTQTWL